MTLGKPLNDMIIVRIKPENVSWEEIRQVIYEAHASNREKGIDIRNAHLSDDEMKQSIGADGICFVALYGDKVVATSSLAFHKLNAWYAQEQKVAYCTLQAVLPEYRGKQLFSRLEGAGIEYACSIGCTGVYKKVAERNVLMRTIAKKDGYLEVSYGRTLFKPHNYITLFKWLGKRPYSQGYIRIRFLLSMIKTKVNIAIGRVK